ncbi:hypothetical protein BDV95DRAFT_479049 [Massariosphaeria phaeospora]|uniref:DUF3176 domain containing protein n=1 Tax=Massariosphaeria phaeospora TaxID=100035 RepID=A0A7C8MJS9_9PLEO|nr:hypothetical protein BDV95DRAFT_479049 [Massariosphaeria phaeospora]
MSTTSEQSPWPRSTEIPIFLDAHDRSDIPHHLPLPVSSAGFRTISPPSKAGDIGSGVRTIKSYGLGIKDGPAPLPAITIQSPLYREKESSPNIAQRIEKKLWRYSASGNVIERWLLEIISWITSAICMGAIIGMLLFFKDKRPPRWLGFTLNAYIAILSKIASAALLVPISEALGQLKWSWFREGSKKMWDFEIFDNASRGPWGAFLLLVRTKGRALAAVGAAVTLLSLALDPFFQQVVDFPERWTFQGNSSIPRVVRFEPRPGTELRSGIRISQQDQDIQAVADKFFYANGTQPTPFGNGTRPDIPLSCPTSNCTWAPYETLGVCSACADVSQLLTYACLTTRIDWIVDEVSIGADYKYPNGTMCGYFLNATTDTPVLMSGHSVDSDGPFADAALLMRALPLISNPKREPLFGGSVKFRHVRNPIADVIIVGAANGTASVYGSLPPVAHECVLAWCVKTIKSSYFWAKYEEEVTDTVLNTTEGPFPWKAIRVSSLTGNGTLLSYTQNISVTAPSNDRLSSDYGLINTTALQTIRIFDDIFPSFTTVTNASAEPLLRYKTHQTTGVMSRSLAINPWMPPNDVTHHMDRLATALTNIIRSSTSSVPFDGEAYDKETYVDVRFWWLTLPLCLLFMTLIFLVSTIVKSSREREQVGVWKTSALATLMYGIPDDMQRKIESSTSTGTPRTKAKELKVKLLPKMGWRVSGNLLSPFTPIAPRNQAPPGWI